MSSFIADKVIMEGLTYDDVLLVLRVKFPLLQSFRVTLNCAYRS